MRTSSWLDLVLVFAPLSLLSIGGGQAIIPEIHRQVVDIHHWLTEAEFVTDYAISRMSPGPSSLVVTLIGWQVAGWLGAFVATLAIYLPSSILVAGLARLRARHPRPHRQPAVEAGLAPSSARMILAPPPTLAPPPPRR